VLADTDARNQVADVWGAELPLSPGRDGDTVLNAAAAGSLALLVAGVDPADLGDPALAMRALEEAPFVVSLEIRESAVTDRADVVLPVAPLVAKAGSFLDWEGRVRPFDATLESDGSLGDLRVLQWLAAEMGIDLGLPDIRTAQAEIARLGAWNGARPPAPDTAAGDPPRPAIGEAVLATWHHLLDDGRLQEHEPYLAGTRRPTVLRLSAQTAAAIGAADGAAVTVSTDVGSITLPLVVTDLPERVVWLPTFSEASHVHATLGVGAGAVVRINAGEGSAP
jgi:NADH-quinone oxidoreductase subunit G